MTFRSPRKPPTTPPDPPGGRGAGRLQWLGLDVFGILLLSFLGLPLLCVGLLRAGATLGLYPPLDESPAALIALAVQELSLLGVTLASVVKGYGRPWRRIGLTGARLWREIALGLSAVPLFYLVQEAGMALSLWGFRLFLPADAVSRLLLQENAALTALVDQSRALVAYFAGLLILLAPLAEEVFFRGFIQEVLRERLGSWRTVVAAAFLFAVIHRYAVQFLPVLFLGLLLSALYEWRRSLTAGITAHAALNLIALLKLLKDLP